MRAWCIVIVVLLGFGTLASAQLTPEEAYQKLKEKEKQRAAEAAAAAATQPADAPPKPNAMEIGRLLNRGWEALVSHQYADAVASFDKAIEADHFDFNGLEGRGICKYELKEYKAADRDLTKAYNLAGRSGPAHVSRQLVIAYAAVEVESDNPMRAVRMIKDVMEPGSQNDRLDEELQNDLGIALSHANEQARKQPLYEEALRFYMDYDRKLKEQKRDGTERWGTKWIDAGEAQHKWKEYEGATKEAAQSVTNYQHAGMIKAHAYDNMLEIEGGLRLHSDAEIYQRTQEYKAAIKYEAVAQTIMNRALQRLGETPKPPFPDRIEHEWEEPR